MNIHTLRTIRHLARSALLATGLATAALPIAHAQELEFAHKTMGSPTAAPDTLQFRSTIIDPSRTGKSSKPDTRTLRVIPISNPAEMAGNKRHCTICGVVESISLAVRNKANVMEPDGESVMEEVGKSQGNARGNLLLTGEHWVFAPVGNNGLKKHVPMFEVKVRMTDGTLRTVNQLSQPEYAVGDYVRVISGAVTTA